MATKKERKDISSFDVDISRGLSSTQVEARIKQKKTNKIKKTVSKSYGKILFDNFCNPFNFLLIVITGVMIWGKLSITHFLFAFILALNIGIGIYQDVHARHLIEKLKVLSDDKCTVIRDGQENFLPKDQIVLSDILVLKQGDQIPADCTLRSGHCTCDESLLTGESVAKIKVVGDPLLSGSYIRSGKCVAEVVKVGSESYAEQLQSTASSFTRPKSEIAQSIWDITVACTLIALVYGIVYVLIAFLKKDLTFEMLFPMNGEGSDFIAGLSGSMVAMLPTGMFLLTSVALTTGVIHLARRNMLVQELYCIEMLARVDVVCFDKTGTLTDGQMTLHKAIPYNGTSADDLKDMVSSLLGATGDDNATAKALKKSFPPKNNIEALCSVPFDSEAKYSAYTSKEGVSYVLGAYGFAPTKKDAEIESLLQRNEKKGYRCLVFGKSNFEIKNGVLPEEFEICGVLVLRDHIKDDAKSNIDWFQSSGVQIYVISGDDPVTVSEIAKACGVQGAEKCIDMSTVSDDAIPLLASQCRVFGRVLPEQKKKIVHALQALGHKVAMTGDGVNDILALKAADCSIAMASGSAAAKNAAHLICTKSDFSSLPDVVAQGRRVINNLQRSCTLFLSKTIFAMLVSTAFLISLAVGGPRYPFSTSHMLVWEVLAIGFASFFLALQPSNDRIEGSMLKNIFAKAVPSGVAEALCVGLPYLFLWLAPNLISYNAEEVYADTVAMSIICFSLFSFWTLYRVSKPLNRYRAVVFGTSLGLGIIVFVIDFFVRVPPGEGVLLRFMWGGYNWSYPIMLLSAAAIAVFVYYLLVFIINKYPKWRKKHS